jgi:hypothetical protein
VIKDMADIYDDYQPKSVFQKLKGIFKNKDKP